MAWTSSVCAGRCIGDKEIAALQQESSSPSFMPAYNTIAQAWATLCSQARVLQLPSCQHGKHASKGHITRGCPMPAQACSAGLTG